MNSMLEKLKQKKGTSKMSPEYKEAKRGMLQHLIGDMGQIAGEGLKAKGLKKVTVASDSPKGLESGLDKAKELLHGKLTPEGDTGDMEMNPKAEEEEAKLSDSLGEEGLEHEATETPAEEAAEHAGAPEPEPCGEHSSDEDLDKEIQRLEIIKASRK